MTYIVPSDISNLALAGCHESEMATISRLKRELPADYTVFQSVHWTRGDKVRTVLGETDFILLNRAGEVLLVEQKNGHLEESAEGLRKRYPDRNDRPVVPSSTVRRRNQGKVLPGPSRRVPTGPGLPCLLSGPPRAFRERCRP